MTTAGPCCNKSGGSTKNDNQQFWTKIHMKTGKSKQNIHAFPRSSVVNVVWIRFCPLWPGCSKARTHRFKMWPQRGEGEVETSHCCLSEAAKTSIWQNTTKIMTSLKMESSTIKALLKLLLITLTFAFLSTACSCSTATFVKVPITSVARLNMNVRILGVVTFLNLHTKTT